MDLFDTLKNKSNNNSIIEEISPIKFFENNIYINSAKFLAWKKENPNSIEYELCEALTLTEKVPTICLFEDNIKVREYCLQTKENEDFSGKYFFVSVRIGLYGNSMTPVALIDGFISDTKEKRKMTMDDIGYRMECYFLACGGDEGKHLYEMNKGQDLPMKALKFQGHTTSSNIRLIGICPDCKKSFCFHGYAFYMEQCDVAYSDDGVDCLKIQEYEFDKNTWLFKTEGKTFRYYNSFNCPHCGTPYIDYKKHPQNKVFGVSGCVLLRRKIYKS